MFLPSERIWGTNMRPQDRLRKVLDRLDAHSPDESSRISDAEPSIAERSTADLTETALDRGAPEVARLAAIESLADRHRRELLHLPTLLALANDPSDRIAEAAIRGLPPFAAETADFLLKRLGSDRPALWRTAAELLARRKEKRLVRTLNHWLVGPDPQRRSMAQSCLCWLLPPEDERAVLENLVRLPQLDEGERREIERRVAKLQDL